MIDPATGGELEGSNSGSVAGLAAASYLVMLIGLVTSPIMARAVGPSGRGEIALALVYLTLATTLVGMGVPLAIAHASANRLHSPGSGLATSVRFCWMITPASAVLAAIVVFGPARDLSLAARIGTGALLVTAPVAVLSLCLGGLLVARGDLRSLTHIQAWTTVALGAGIVAAFVAHNLTVGVYLAIMLATTFLSAVISWRAVGIRREGAVPIKPLVKFGVRGYAGYFAMTGSLRLDQAFIGPVLGSRLLGIYAVSASLSILPFTLARAVASRAFGAVAAADGERRPEVMSQFLRITILAAAVVSLAIGVVSPVLVPMLYGSAFSQVVGPLLIMLPGAVALSGSGTASVCLSAVGRPGKTTIAEVSGLVVTLLGLPFVVPTFGITGAAVLSTVTYLTTFVVYCVFLRRLGPVGWWPGRREVRTIGAAVGRRMPIARVRRLSEVGGGSVHPPSRPDTFPDQEGEH